MKNKRVLLVDGNNNCHRAYHKFANTKNGGIKTSIIWGLPYIMNAHLTSISPDKMVIFWDGQKSPERIKICPEYKLKRGSLTDYQDFLFQKEKVIEFFHNVGVPQFYDSRFEADDLIYKYTRFYHKRGWDVLILSKDKDFHQLIKPGISVFQHDRNMPLTHNNLHKFYDYTPKQCVDYLCLDGDSSDNIPGYPGMGPVNIQKFLKEFSSIQRFLDSKDSFGRLDKKILLELYKKNRMMIDLKLFYRTHIYKKLKPRYYKGIKKPSFNQDYVDAYTEEFNIKSFHKPVFLNNFKRLLA